jgi:DNA repair protein RecO
LGKAIRKIKSKLRAGAELFYLSEIEFIQGRNHKTLTDAISIERFKNIRKNLEKLKIAYQISQTADDLIKGQEKDQKIWNLLNETFNKLNIQELNKTRTGLDSLIYYYFLWNLLSLLGYQIDLYNCVLCQKKLLPQKLHFSLKDRGIICLECFKKVKRGQEISPVSPDVIKILRFFLKKDWQVLSRLRIAEPYEKSLKSVSENYLSCVQG